MGIWKRNYTSNYFLCDLFLFIKRVKAVKFQEMFAQRKSSFTKVTRANQTPSSLFTGELKMMKTREKKKKEISSYDNFNLIQGIIKKQEGKNYFDAK